MSYPGHHINEAGEFQSDKHPDLPPDRVRINLGNPLSERGLRVLASCYKAHDPEFAVDLDGRLDVLHGPTRPVTCDECHELALIHAADKDTQSHWCLDHAPEQFADEVAEMRAYAAWADSWAIWLSKQEAENQPVPSWRVAASSAFMAGIKFARGKV